MSRKHFKKLKEIYKTEGFWQATKYDFDNSILRLLVPYPSEFVPLVLGIRNYRTLIDKTEEDDNKKFRIFKQSVCGVLSYGSEAARYIATAVVYNETKSLEAGVLAYYLSSSFFSLRNQFRINRFYKPSR